VLCCIKNETIFISVEPILTKHDIYVRIIENYIFVEAEIIFQFKNENDTKHTYLKHAERWIEI